MVQNNIVTDAINELNKRREATCVFNFDFFNLYTKFPLNKLLVVLNRFIDICFDGSKNRYITVNSNEACWIKEIKNNVRCRVLI